MNTTTNAFIYGITQSIGDTAVAYTLTAARWGVLAWDAATSDTAIAAYRQGWQLARSTALFCIGLGILTRRAVQAWVDAQVEGALPKTDVPAAADWEMVDPFDPSVNPLPTAIAVEAPAKPPTIRQLKAQAKAAKVPNYGRMTKTQLREALAAA